MVAVGWQIEQIFLACGGLFFTAGFLHQLVQELRAEAVGKLKYIFHRLGFIAAVLILVRSLDPHGFFNILRAGLLFQFLTSNITVLILSAAASAVYFSLNSFNQLVSGSRQLIARILAWTTTILVFGTIVCANLSAALEFAYNRRSYGGIYLAWLGVAFIVILILFNGITFILVRAIRELATGEDARLERAARDMRRFQIIGSIPMLIAIPLEWWIALDTLRSTRTPLDEHDPVEFSLRDTTLGALQIVALAVMLWWSFLHAPKVRAGGPPRLSCREYVRRSCLCCASRDDRLQAGLLDEDEDIERDGLGGQDQGHCQNS